MSIWPPPTGCKAAAPAETRTALDSQPAYEWPVGGGWVFETTIINQPQSAILGTGSITDRPVVKDGQIVIAPIMTYSFTFDHRVIDGVPGTAFMNRVTELLENPELLRL